MSTCGDHEETKSVFIPKLCLIPKCDTKFVETDYRSAG